MLSKSGTSGTIADIKLITCSNIKTLAYVVILSHNQPSGSLRPYKEDLLITKKLPNSLKLFDIKIIEQLLITSVE